MSKLYKTSVHFIFANNRKRSCTFPGSVSKRGKALLQEWCRQFRQGETIHSRPADQRRVRSVSNKKNITIISREHAWTWFRELQQKYSALFHEECSENGVPEPYLKAPLIRSISPELILHIQKKEIKKNDTDNTKTKTSGSDVSDKDYNIKRFVEIEWSSNSSFNEAPSCVYLMVGTTRVVINTLQHGNGSYFDAATIPVGIYMIRGVPGSEGIRFEVKANNSSGIGATNKSVAFATSSTSSPASPSPAAGPPPPPSTAGNVKPPTTTDETNESNESKSSFFLSETTTSSPCLSTSSSTTTPYMNIPIDSEVIESQHRYSSLFAKNQYVNNTMQTDSMNTNGRLASAMEVNLLKELKYTLGTVLTTGKHSKHLEIVGDFNLLRYLRGKSHNVTEAAACFQRHIAIRNESNWHGIREQLAAEGYNEYENLWKFSLDNLPHSTALSRIFSIDPNAGLDVNGDVVVLFKLPHRTHWINELFQALNYGSGWKANARCFLSTLFIFRQMQVDLLSRQQGRIVRSIGVWDVAGGMYWRGINATYREFMVEHNKVVESVPNLSGKTYMPGMTWFMRKVYSYVKWTVSEQIRNHLVGFGIDSHTEMLAVLGPHCFAKFLELRNISDACGKCFKSV
jgi:hypothetical protein